MISTSFYLNANGISVSIAPYFENKKAAVTYTFDDGLRCQLTKAIPVLNELDFKATFFVITAVTPDYKKDAEKMNPGDWGSIAWEEWEEVIAQGHEIGNHSPEHKNLRDMSLAEASRRILQAQVKIQNKLNISPLTFCYPYNARTEELETFVHYQFPFSRTYQKGFGSSINQEAMDAVVKKAIDQGKWEVIMLHGIDSGYDKFDNPNELFKHWRYVKTIEKEVWVDTFAGIGDYITLAKNTNIQTTHKKNIFSIRLKNTTAKLQNTKLTLILKGIRTDNFTVKQGEKILAVQKYTDHYLVNVEPNETVIKIQYE
ncbi:MAG: polysaccharide deacetylase family protein [Lentisphaeria bacterium]|nr:polysaccharide deacetylase family protein [Lentisphaeria bacterium]